MTPSIEIAKQRIYEILDDEILLSPEDDKEYVLDLANLGLTAIPEEIYQIKNLKELDLSNNELTNIPSKFAKFIGLRYLDLRNNNIQSLPDWFKQFETAKNIDFREEPEIKFDEAKNAIGLFLFGNPLPLNKVPRRINIFISYSHEDLEELTQFEKWLKAWKKWGNIEFEYWNDGEIRAGKDWLREIKTKLDSANVVVYLVSINFLSSDFISDIEMLPVFERLKENEDSVLTFSVIIKECRDIWKETPLYQFQPVPLDEHRRPKPISHFDRQDDGWHDAVSKIKKAINEKFNQSIK